LQAASALSISSVRFTERRLPGQSDPWLEAQIDLRGTSSSPNIPIEDVSVNLWVLFKESTGKFCYLGKAKLYTLVSNASVRFYLPPDVVRAHRLSQSPNAYLVEVSSSQGGTAYNSPLLASSSAKAELKAFSTQPLLPHYATPFYSISDTFRDLPSYVVP
jgi:hypothetical protein